MQATRRWFAAVLLLATSCTHQASPESGGASVPRPSRDANVISRAELQDPVIAGRDANFAIQQLRPAFFRTRGSQSLTRTSPDQAPGQVHISMDFGPLQAVSALSGIDTRSLVEIRYLDAVQATARFGINANGGPVIVLLTTMQ